jgi:hypothetical protein
MRMLMISLGVGDWGVRPYSSEIQNEPSSRRTRPSQSMASLRVPSCALPAGKRGNPSAAGKVKAASNLD